MKLALLFTGLILGVAGLARRVAHAIADRANELARAALGLMEP